jgi:hypothetical protein
MPKDKQHEEEEKEWEQPIETLSPEKIYLYMRVEQILNWLSGSREKTSARA